MTDPLRDRRIALGVTGSIAAYKALTITSELTKAGAEVDVLLTRSAQEFVRPLSFQALSHRAVVSDLFAPTGVMALDHVSIARAAEVFVVAPATADVLARLVLGRADDAVTATALATRAPMVFAPAMEPNMWSHDATQGHVAALLDRGVTLVGPESGRMASGERGIGRMAEPESVVAAIRAVLAVAVEGPLSGRCVVVTAGPTRESLDPVRFISNRSTGRMGYALAAAARDLGADVQLISGPTALDAPSGIIFVPVETADEMCGEVLSRAPSADLLLMAAAVADYRIEEPFRSKIKKGPGGLDLNLIRTADVLVELNKQLGDRAGPVRIGFAAESDELVGNARGKLESKALDLVVANPVPASFGDSEVSAILVDHDRAEEIQCRSKLDVAEAILGEAVKLMESRDSAAETDAGNGK